MPIHHDALGNRAATTERVFARIAGPAQGARDRVAFENVLSAGAVIPLHFHPAEELLACLAGEAECSFDGGAPQPYRAGSVE